ncbi:MAG: LCP family protein [Christensenellales bacterium]
MKRFLSLVCLAALLLQNLPPLAAAAQAEAASGIELTDEQMRQIDLSLLDESKEMPVGDQFRLHVSADDLSVQEGLDEDWMNILILGTDTGNKRLNYGRTDAMMIASLNTRTGKIKLTSLVRDMLVDIPGLRNQNRINTANAFGGPNLAMKTANQVLGLNITHYCSINFAGFASIVDYLGGVELALSIEEAKIVGARYTTEPQVLSGAQALSYVRIRQLDNNFGRNERQRQLLVSLLNKVKTSSLDKALGAVTETFKTISTNLTAFEVIMMLPAVLRNGEQLDTLSLPSAGAFQYATTSWGASVVTFDQAATRQAFTDFVYSGAGIAPVN